MIDTRENTTFDVELYLLFKNKHYNGLQAYKALKAKNAPIALGTVYDRYNKFKKKRFYPLTRLES